MRGRLVWVTCAVLVCFCVVVGKLVFLQVAGPDRYVDRARFQRLSAETLRAPRGAIFDRNGQPLVTSVERQSIWADPKFVVDPRGTAQALAPLLGRDPVGIHADLLTSGRFVYLQRQVSDDVAAAVQALGLPGIATLAEPTRSRPAGDLAEAVIGSTNIDNVGVSGLELQLDELLRGTDGEMVAERGPLGQSIPSGERRVQPAVRGSNVVLTLDRDLQAMVEIALANQVDAVQAAGGTALLMNPTTGEILAMATVKRDATTGQVRNDAENFSVSGTYEPGSVMKVVPIAALVDRGVVGPDTPQVVPSSIVVHDVAFSDDHPIILDPVTRPQATVLDVMAESSNVGTIKLAQQLGDRGLASALAVFGFGRTTKVGLDAEVGGSVPFVEDWSGTTLPSIAIGHTMTATPLQVLTAYNAIANGGEWVRPKLISSEIDATGKQVDRPAADRQRIMKPETSSAMRRMLAAVVKDGTGSKAAVEGYEVAGKTGTAWKLRANGDYGAGKDRDYVATFVGFAPADNPRISMIVVIDEPRTAYYGGSAAAPVFGAVARQVLANYDVMPYTANNPRSPTGNNLRALPSAAIPATTLRPTTTVPAPTSTTAAPPSSVPGATTTVTVAPTSTSRG